MALRNRRTIRDALIVIGLARAAFYYIVQGIHPWTYIGTDARAYWQINLAHPYLSSGVGDLSTYLYSPAFAQVMAPFSLLPWPVYDALWTVLLVGILAWLVKPWPWALLILFLPISYELFVGNVHFLIAAALVVGLSRPGALALPILTKITPGISWLWFLVRREWRNLAISMAVTGAIVAVSFVLQPGAWSDWIAFLLASTGRGDALIPRIALGIVLVLFGAATGRAWLVPVAVWIALPVVWINAWVILLASIRLYRDGAAAPVVNPFRVSLDCPRRWGRTSDLGHSYRSKEP
ncbi:MAG TPA: glycosyltransferase family 87 protein [Candidatus Limnocylindrales bacterium]|nr:glycosyltransferase family 87 protein [Candidatus Limnocylindrales bacterium]